MNNWYKLKPMQWNMVQKRQSTPSKFKISMDSEECFNKLNKTDKFIELIKYTLGLFGIDSIEKKEFYSGKNNSKRFKLKYNGICGCEIELNLKNFETDSIFEEIFKLINTKTYEEIIEYINNIKFKCCKKKYTSKNKKNIIDHIISQECNKKRKNNILKIQEELLNKRIYKLNGSKRYHYCRGQNKGYGKWKGCCNLDDENCEKIFIGSVIFNIQPIDNFVLTHSHAMKNNHTYINPCPQECKFCNKELWEKRNKNKNIIEDEIEDKIIEYPNIDEIIKDKQTHKKYENKINGKSFPMTQSEYRRLYNVTQIKIEKDGQCLHCGNNDIRLLELDHINKNKLFNIAGCSIIDYEKLKEEADKTQPLCRVCHRIKTSNNTKLRNNKHLNCFWFKESYSLNEIIELFGTCNNKEIKRYIINEFKKSGCRGCGCKKYINNYPEVYECNHLCNKKSKVCHISLMKDDPKYNVLDVYNEILKCEVLCGNCHKLYTLQQNNSIFYEIKNKDDFLKLEKPQYRQKETIYNEKYINSKKNGIRIYIRNEKMKKKHGKYPLKIFHFKDYENEETALEAAIKYRNELLS